MQCRAGASCNRACIAPRHLNRSSPAASCSARPVITLGPSLTSLGPRPSAPQVLLAQVCTEADRLKAAASAVRRFGLHQVRPGAQPHTASPPASLRLHPPLAAGLSPSPLLPPRSCLGAPASPLLLHSPSPHSPRPSLLSLLAIRVIRATRLSPRANMRRRASRSCGLRSWCIWCRCCCRRLCSCRRLLRCQRCGFCLSCRRSQRRHLALQVPHALLERLPVCFSLHRTTDGTSWLGMGGR
jgi:hypothetical protein